MPVENPFSRRQQEAEFAANQYSRRNEILDNEATAIAAQQAIFTSQSEEKGREAGLLALLSDGYQILSKDVEPLADVPLFKDLLDLQMRMFLNAGQASVADMQQFTQPPQGIEVKNNVRTISGPDHVLSHEGMHGPNPAAISLFLLPSLLEAGSHISVPKLTLAGDLCLFNVRNYAFANAGQVWYGVEHPSEDTDQSYLMDAPYVNKNGLIKAMGDETFGRFEASLEQLQAQIPA